MMGVQFAERESGETVAIVYGHLFLCREWGRRWCTIADIRELLLVSFDSVIISQINGCVKNNYII